MASPAASPPDICRLQHVLFCRFSDPVFRRAETDGTPVMVVMLGDREAALPLRALQREFGIADDSPDGRMLALVAAALDFVTALRPGNPLPLEVLSGEASWEPGPQHLRLATARLRLRLVAWLCGGGEDPSTLEPRALLAAADDPALGPQVQEAFRRVAEEMKLEDPATLPPMLAVLAEELAYVEALRERLLQPVQSMQLKLTRLTQGWRGDASELEKLTHVRQLNSTAPRRIGSRFEELDAQTGEVLAALRNLDSQRNFIRANRDWLYQTQRAWQPLLLEWEHLGFGYDEHARAVIERTYRFLAPRFMPVTEWVSRMRTDPAKKRDSQQRGMIW